MCAVNLAWTEFGISHVFFTVYVTIIALSTKVCYKTCLPDGNESGDANRCVLQLFSYGF